MANWSWYLGNNHYWDVLLFFGLGKNSGFVSRRKMDCFVFCFGTRKKKEMESIHLMKGY